MASIETTKSLTATSHPFRDLSICTIFPETHFQKCEFEKPNIRMKFCIDAPVETLGFEAKFEVDKIDGGAIYYPLIHL